MIKTDLLKSWQIEEFGEEQKGILMIVWLENRTIIGKKMNRGIYAIIVIGESLSGEKSRLNLRDYPNLWQKYYRRK